MPDGRRPSGVKRRQRESGPGGFSSEIYDHCRSRGFLLRYGAFAVLLSGEESFELPGADLSGEELTVKVIPKQADEFTCSVCFLVQHRSRLATDNGGRLVCVDCA